MTFNRIPRLASRRRFGRAGAGIAALALLAALPASARAETYFSVYFGGSRTQDSDLRVVQPSTNTDATFQNVSWGAQNFESPPYYGLKLGGYSEKSPNWGVELDFVHYKVYAKVDEVVPVSGTWNGAPVAGSERLGNRVQRFDISHGVNTLALVLLYRWLGKPTPSFPRGRLQPYVGVGPAYYIHHPENRVNGIPNRQEYKPGGLGWQAQGGVRYGVSKRLTLFTEGKYSSGEGEVRTHNDGWATTDLRTWQVAGGVQYGF
ncbi:MAG: outer membrane beta-barrel protein [Armatimonadetes bacterium]|nr:outer membrane beta-barrel protein [Armatimonadota bacterium]